MNGALVTSTQLRPDQDEIAIKVPALRRYVGAVRTFTTALAVQCDLTVDDIEDVQMAIDEACALLLPHVDRARPWLEVKFHLVVGRFVAEVQVATTQSVEIDRDGLSWTVLDSLGDEVHVSTEGRVAAISFTKLRGVVRT